MGEIKNIALNRREIRDEDLLRLVPKFKEKEEGLDAKEFIKEHPDKLRFWVKNKVHDKQSPHLSFAGKPDIEQTIAFTIETGNNEYTVLGEASKEAFLKYMGEPDLNDAAINDERVKGAVFVSERERVLAIYGKAEAINRDLMDIGESRVMDYDLPDVNDAEEKVGLYMDGVAVWFDRLPLSFASGDLLDETLEEISEAEHIKAEDLSFAEFDLVPESAEFSGYTTKNPDHEIEDDLGAERTLWSE